MGVTKVGLFLWIICHLLLLLLKAHSKCHPSFPCRNFTLEFPFTHINDPSCGLFPVDGCDSQAAYPTVRIGAAQTPRSTLNILGRKSETRTLLVHDFILQTLLDNRMCLAFTDMSLINTPSVSFTFSPNITVFGCLNETNSAVTAEYFTGFDTKDCDPVSLYYKRSPATTRETRSTPYGCAMVQLPRSSNDSSDLINLVSATFTVDWSVSEACSECYNGGGKCLTDYQNQFYCTLQGDGSHETFRKYFLIGCVTTGVFASISISLILFIIKLYAHPKLFGFENVKSMNEKDIELLLKNNGDLAPVRYKYSDIEKMTNLFTQRRRFC
ncbi:hypothetical protein ACS0TY_033340 [Phlomoides rotata]